MSKSHENELKKSTLDATVLNNYWPISYQLNTVAMVKHGTLSEMFGAILLALALEALTVGKETCNLMTTKSIGMDCTCV